jgi:hypothetical protein
VIVALNVLLIHWMKGDKNSLDDVSPSSSSFPQENTSQSGSREVAPEKVIPIKITEPTPEKLVTPDPLDVKALIPPALPTVNIKRIEPAEPQVGKSLEISVESSGATQGKLKYEYRVQPAKKWETAEGGRIKITPISPGPIEIEVRLIDERGEPSPIVKRRLVVKPVPEPADKTFARFKMGDKFRQEVIVTRRSAYRILGQEVGQNVQYGFISSFTVDKVEADGSCVFTQKVETARWGEGDENLKSLLDDALRKTEGAKFEMTVRPSGEITKFKGPKDPVNVFADKNPLSGQTFLLWSFLDDDSWKELAQITFFLPEKPLRTGTSWTRDLNHAWGPLGGWTGKTTYSPQGKQAGIELIDYAHEMTYQPPKGSSRDLPFQVQKAEFKPQTARGAILYDPARSRVAAAEERFRVRGLLTLSVAGSETAVEMDEDQFFRLRVLEPKPAK